MPTRASTSMPPPLGHWVPYVVGQRDSITVAMDWTEFDADGQATIMLFLLSRHGRATPVWLTVDKATLKNRRNGYEYQVLVRLAEILPADVRVVHRGHDRTASATTRPLSGAERGTEVRLLRHPLSRQYRGHRHRWRDAGRGRLGWRRWSRANTARCCGHRPGVSGRHRGLRAGEGHERAVVPGRQHRRRTRAGLDQPVCQALGRSRAVSATQRISASAWGSDRCMSAFPPDRRDRSVADQCLLQWSC